MNTFLWRVTATFSAIAFALAAHTTEAATVRGQLLDANQQPIASARIRVPALDLSVRTDADGRFELNEVSTGTLLLDIEAGRAGHQNREIDVADELVELTLQLDGDVEHMVVSASALEHRPLDMAAPTQVLAGDDLLKARASTIGETLDNLPGVSAASFGAGSSRPVIRGLGGARVQMLQDGVSTLDASTVSPDHNVAAESLTTEQIEVLRGPATLLYGSGAIGGVVNVIDRRVPEQRIGGVEGAVELRGQSGNDEKSAAVSLDAGAAALALHVDAFQRETSDIDIPGDAERFPEAEEPTHEGEELAHGSLPNSSTDSDGGAVGLSWVGNRGFVGIAVSEYNSNYGIPGHHPHHEAGEEETAEEAPVRVDLEQQRIDLKARLDDPLKGIESLKLRIGQNDYQHTELEGAEIGTRFSSDASDSRLEATHAAFAGWKGVIGMQLTDRDFAAVGEEAFVPPSVTESEALFWVEEKELGDLHLEAGLRHEQQHIDVDAGLADPVLPDSDLPDYEDTAFSWSLGGVYELGKNWSTTLSYAHAERMPTAEELYSDGPHVATQSYELGNVNLQTETASNIDIGLRYQSDSASLMLSVFRNDVADFIYTNPTGTELDELPVYQYEQHDATLEGIELAWDWTFWEQGGSALTLTSFYDQIDGSLDGGGKLPRIPPQRLSLGLDFDRGDWRTSVDAVFVDDQTDVAANETPTDGYTLLSAAVMYRLTVGDSYTDLFLRGSNLLDEEVRLHTSPLKDIAPQMGRSVSAGLRLHF